MEHMKFDDRLACNAGAIVVVVTDVDDETYEEVKGELFPGMLDVDCTFRPRRLEAPEGFAMESLLPVCKSLIPLVLPFA